MVAFYATRVTQNTKYWESTVLLYKHVVKMTSKGKIIHNITYNYKARNEHKPKVSQS